jgi:hypothetical protein
VESPSSQDINGCSAGRRSHKHRTMKELAPNPTEFTLSVPTRIMQQLCALLLFDDVHLDRLRSRQKSRHGPFDMKS